MRQSWKNNVTDGQTKRQLNSLDVWQSQGYKSFWGIIVLFYKAINNHDINTLKVLLPKMMNLSLRKSASPKLLKVACRIKINTTWTTKSTTSFYYFSKKFKSNDLQGHKRYIKIFESEINNLRVQILAAKMMWFHFKILPFASSKSL